MIMRKTTLLLLLCLSILGCVRYTFKGSAAVIDETSSIKIVKKSKNYGDCHKSLGNIPIVYSINRENYTVVIAHGNRYWPDLYMGVTNKTPDSPLSIKSDSIDEVDDFHAFDVSDLEKERGVKLTHIIRLDKNKDHTIKFKIIDSDGNVLGDEELSYHLEDVKCHEIDAL